MLRLDRFTVRRIAEVERRRRHPGNDVVGDPGVEPRHGHDLTELEPFDDSDPWSELEQGEEATHGTFEGAVGEPRARRVAARPLEHESCDDVPEAPRMELEVGRLEHDCERRLVDHP